jgi:hypothetical protein
LGDAKAAFSNGSAFDFRAGVGEFGIDFACGATWQPYIDKLNTVLHYDRPLSHPGWNSAYRYFRKRVGV